MRQRATPASGAALDPCAFSLRGPPLLLAAGFPRPMRGLVAGFVLGPPGAFRARGAAATGLRETAAQPFHQIDDLGAPRLTFRLEMGVFPLHLALDDPHHVLAV